MTLLRAEWEGKLEASSFKVRSGLDGRSREWAGLRPGTAAVRVGSGQVRPGQTKSNGKSKWIKPNESEEQQDKWPNCGTKREVRGRVASIRALPGFRPNPT